jgi:HSP20 family protein
MKRVLQQQGGREMALVRLRRDPWDVLDSWYDDMSRMLVPSSFRSFNVPLSTGYRGMPSVDMWEDEKNVYFEADIPGMEPKDIKVGVEDGTLTISAQKEETKEEEDRNYYRTERYSGSYYREMPLPSSVDPEKVVASSKNGVLRVTLPKREKEVKKTKQVEVTEG